MRKPQIEKSPRLRPCGLFALALAAVAFLAMHAPALAQPAPDPAAPATTNGGADASAETAESNVEEGSPRASMLAYLRFCRAGNFDGAAQYLELPPGTSDEEAAALARRLKSVLDASAWIDIEALSPLSSGHVGDGFGKNTDEVAQIVSKKGKSASVRMRKVTDAQGTRWAFNARTVKLIPEWFAQLPHGWLIDALPDWAMKTGPKELLWWQWIAFILLL